MKQWQEVEIGMHQNGYPHSEIELLDLSSPLTTWNGSQWRVIKYDTWMDR